MTAHPFVEHGDCTVSATNATYQGPDKTVSVRYAGGLYDAKRFSGRGSFGKNFSRAYGLLKTEQQDIAAAKEKRVVADSALALRATPIATTAARICRVLG